MYRKGLINMQENKRNSQIKKRSIKCTEHKEAFQFSNFSICLRKTINKMFSLSTPHPPQKKKREREKRKEKQSQTFEWSVKCKVFNFGINLEFISVAAAICIT
jgi:hypothetical protein